MKTTESNARAYKMPDFLLTLLFGTFLFFNGPAIQAKPFKSVVGSVALPAWELTQFANSDLNNQGRLSKTNYDTDMSTGYWYSNRKTTNYCIEFEGNQGTSNWNMLRCFDKGLFQKKENNVFVMTKETGTLQLNGNLDAEVGQGKYTFTEDTSFKKYLADNHISSNNRNLLFRLFFGDVNKAYVQFLKKHYSEVNGDRLLELAIHGVSQQKFQGFLTLFQKHGNKTPTIADVIAAHIHGINEAYVQELQRLGYNNLSLDKMMEAKIHGVNATYVEGLTNGFGKQPIDKVIAAKIHGVTPATVKEMRALGFGDLTLDKTIELQIHGVKPAYMNDLKAMGFEGLTLDQVMEAKIHGLNPAGVKEMKAMGYKDLTFGNMISAQIHGVNLAYVQDLQKAGFQNLTMDKTIEAKIHGLDSSFIKKAREQGYNLKSIDKYISLKIHGLAMESLKD